MKAEFQSGGLTAAGFSAARDDLETKFAQSDSKFNGAPKAIEKGGQEEFKILHGTDSLLNVNKQQLRAQEQSAATLKRVEDKLEPAGLKPTFKIPP